MKHTFIILDDNSESILKTLAVAASFQNLHFIASAKSYKDGLNLILEHQPTFVFLEIDPENKESNLSLLLINELYRFLKVLPQIIVTSNNKELAFEAIQYQVLDFFIKPLEENNLRKTLLKFEKANQTSTFTNNLQPSYIAQDRADEGITIVNEIPVIHQEVIEENDSVISIEKNSQENEENTTEDSRLPIKKNHNSKETSKEEKPLIICVKSYGDYRFIEAKDICYLQADNNSTDIHLFNGEMVTAFKTLKHFENVLVSPFVRIHNSYIVNIEYVSRIHTGNSVCYIKNTTTKLPFSKSYKENVDAIINSITNGNYLEI